MMRIDTEEFFVGKDGGEEIGEIGDGVAMQSSSNSQPKMESQKLTLRNSLEFMQPNRVNHRLTSQKGSIVRYSEPSEDQGIVLVDESQGSQGDGAQYQELAKPENDQPVSYEVSQDKAVSESCNSLRSSVVKLASVASELEFNAENVSMDSIMLQSEVIRLPEYDKEKLQKQKK